MDKDNKLLKFAILSISTLLLSATAVHATVPHMRDALNLTQAQSELIVTMPSLAVIVVVLFSSSIAKRLGMKKTVLIGIFLTGLGGIIPVFTNNLHLIFVSRLIFGGGIGLFNSLAVSYINVLYLGDERASMLGKRASMEALGQFLTTFGVGILLNIGWHLSFAVYALAFPIAAFFYLVVPDITNDVKVSQTRGKKESINPMVYLYVFVVAIFIMCGAALSIRFPSIAAEIKGENFNAALVLATKPILGIVAGLLFGVFNKWLGKKLLYLGVFLLAISSFLVGFSNGNFSILLVAFLIGGFTPAWVFPFVLNKVSNITSGSNQSLATSLVFVGINVGVFMVPIAKRLSKFLTGNYTLESPFTVFGILLLLVLGGLIYLDIREKNKKFI